MSTSVNAQEIAAAIGDALSSAKAQLAAGDLNTAEQLYRAVLQLDAHQPDANHALACMAARCGQIEAAVDLFITALLAAPQREVFWLDYLEVLTVSGNMEAAREALALSRQQGLQLTGAVIDRIEPRQHISGPQPSTAELNALDEAFRRGDVKRLEQLAHDACTKYPGAPAGWKSLSLVYFHSGRTEEAIAPSLKLVEMLPHDALVHANLGLVYMTLRHLSEAEACLQQAIALDPNAADAHVNLGNVRRDQGRHAEAEVCYRRAITIQPDHSVAIANLGVVQLETGDFRSAETNLRAALRIAPNNAVTLGGLATALIKLGKLEEAAEVTRRSIALDPDNIFAYDLLLFAFNYTHAGKSREARELALLYDKHVRSKIDPPYQAWHCTPSPQRLKIGLVSGDLNNHPVGFFTETLLRHLDPERFEVIVYSSMPERKNDALTARVHGLVSAWRPIHLLSYTQAAEQIHTDGIHILLDLSGHTTDNRLPVFAMKPAPVQASWLGYFATTGVAEMDWFIGDPWLCPPGEEADFTERVWRLPQTWLCFTPPELDVAVAALPALSNGYVTFGCFNNLNKMNDRVVALWAALLHRLPDSRLLLKAPQLRDSEVCAETIARYAAHGIPQDRLTLEGPDARDKYLAAYGKVDIGLDPFPYPGGTTSVESLWMGVPVLTLQGDRFLSHLGESIAHNAGLADWVATSPDAYLDKAMTFAADLPALATLREGMRARLQATPLLDAPRFGRDFADMLWAMWQCKGEGHTAPASKPPVQKQPTATEVRQLEQAARKGNHAELEKRGSSVAASYPHAAAGWRALSLARYYLGKFEPALAATQKLLEIEPQEAGAHMRLGLIQVRLAHLAEAEVAFSQALKFEPQFADAYVNLGYISVQRGALEEAVSHYEKAIAINPRLAAPHSNIGVIMLKARKLRAAERSFRAALALDPKDKNALTGLCSTLVRLGFLAEAEALSHKAIRIYPEDPALYSTLLFSLNYNNADNSGGDAFGLAQRYGAMLSRTCTPRYTSWLCEPTPERLRIGLVSGDLHKHPVGYFLEGLVQNLDPARVELYAYSNGAEKLNDEMTARLRACCAHWTTIENIDDKSVAARIHADGIHILLDLAGHTGNTRLPVFAYKPAPIQAAWLGYFATTGVQQMDYLIGDPNVCPPNEESHFTETIWRLPETYLCFTPPNVDVSVGPLPMQANGHVTFGCFNNTGKLTESVVRLWSQILQKIPGAQLLLKASQLADADICRQIAERFAAYEIGPTRLILEGPSSRHDYLAAYNRVDIVLDPFPYPGGTTSVEALWMGVPVLTLRGNRMLSHAGENIMRNLGLPEWIAENEAEYLAKAAAFATEAAAVAALAGLRANLRERALASPMFNAAPFARHFEQALWGMWETNSSTART